MANLSVKTLDVIEKQILSLYVSHRNVARGPKGGFERGDKRFLDGLQTALNVVTQKKLECSVRQDRD